MIIILDFDLMTTMTPEIINNPYIGTNLGMDPFPDPLSHFGALWSPFLILQAALQAVNKCPQHC